MRYVSKKIEVANYAISIFFNDYQIYYLIELL
jgi:hypothetical protein